MPHDLFISYSTEDKNIALAICSKLEQRKIRCWIAPRDINPGDNFAEAIMEAINTCKIMVVIFSEASNKSPYVLREVERAVKKNAIIIPFKIDDIEPSKGMEFFLYTQHWLDAINPPLEENITKLADVAARILGLPPETDIPDTKQKTETQSAQETPVPANGRSGNHKKTLFWVFGALTAAIALTIIIITAGQHDNEVSRVTDKPAIPTEITGTPALTAALQTSAASPELSEEGGVSQTQPIQWKEPEIEKAVRAYLNKPSGDLTPNDLSKITSLFINGNVITINKGGLSNNADFGTIARVDDIAYFTNLNYLAVEKNNVSDIGPLGNLKNLTELNLEWEQISDISALSGLTNLTVLDLAVNRVSDISALSSLTKLTKLNLWGDQISDIGALSNLKNLTELNLQANEISDISGLSNLTNLTFLSLEQNNVSDISALSNLTNLTDLELYYNKISDINALSNLTNLTKLGLQNNQITDVSALSNLKNLISLNIISNNITDYSPLNALPKSCIISK